MRIVMLGKTGAGKSSVANTILGENVFKIGDTGNSETSKCRSVTGRVDGRDVTLIDTPGFFDTGRSEEKPKNEEEPKNEEKPKNEEELKAAIVKCITECSPGPHAFIIVLKMETFTDLEQEVINKINQYFSEEAFKYATVLFTHGDQLQEGQTVEQYFRNNHLVSDLMKKCGGRCHVIDNKYWKNNQPDDYRSNQFQVKQLMKTIDHMIEANNGSCFTNKMLQAVEKLIQEEEEKIRQSPGKKTNKEIREEAKKRAYRHLINLTGVTTGVLLGALLGGVVVVAVVVKALKEALSEEKVRRALPAIGVGVGVGGGAAVGGVGLVVGGEAAAIAAGSLMVAGVLGGAIKGGLEGYDAAQEADRAGEAAKKAADAVIGTVTCLFKGRERTANNKSELKPLIGPDS